MLRAVASVCLHVAKSLTGCKLCATTTNNMQQGAQTDTNNVASVCAGLNTTKFSPPLWLFSLFHNNCVISRTLTLFILRTRFRFQCYCSVFKRMDNCKLWPICYKVNLLCLLKPIAIILLFFFSLNRNRLSLQMYLLIVYLYSVEVGSS